jgi:phage gp16-like protein
MAAHVSPRQIVAIHAIAKRAGLDDELRRDVIRLETGKHSSRELTFAEAGRVIEKLKAKLVVNNSLNGGPAPAAHGAVKLDGPFAMKLRALWISGWNLGVVRDRTDKALCAFIERQTKVSHPRFLREPALAAKAIEGLKAWLAREAGVVWPPRDADVLDVKLAVVEAQTARLVALDQSPATDAVELDDIANILGARLRRALAQQPAPTNTTEGEPS